MVALGVASAAASALATIAPSTPAQPTRPIEVWQLAATVLVNLLMIVAVVYSPKWALRISERNLAEKEKHDRQFSVLLTTIETSSVSEDPKAVRALNAIDLLFHDSPPVVALWHQLHQMSWPQGPEDREPSEAVREAKRRELISEMAGVLGYDPSGDYISHIYGEPLATSNQATAAASKKEGSNVGADQSSDVDASG